MNLLALPAFSDNYIWMFDNGREAAVVDPGDAAPVLEALERKGLALAAILVTHHHPDHVGGVNALRPHLSGPVFGPARERIPEPFEPLHEGQRINVLGLSFEVLDVPGHTAGHIAYLQRDVDHAAWLFCGDTLFSAGCGRLFEGTPQQMHHSLGRLAALPGDTQVCCTHEYTLGNLRFAQAVEPGNQRARSHAQHCMAQRERGEPTLPSSMALELEINPFLRCHQPEVVTAALKQGAASADAVDVFASLREWKNVYR